MILVPKFQIANMIKGRWKPKFQLWFRSQAKMCIIAVLVALGIGFLCQLKAHASTGAAEYHIPVLELTHRYTSHEGSHKNTGGRGMTVELIQLLKSHDRGHMRRLSANVVSLPIGGVADPYVAGLYFAQITIGTPPKDYFVQVDTGSDLLWLNCQPCVGCPSSSDLKIPIVSYDVRSSSSSSSVLCTDNRCLLASKISESGCNDDERCGYAFEYGDGSVTVGYLVEDMLHYSGLVNSSYMASLAAPILFGCGFNQSGELAASSRALDGILGLGSSDLSIISQLAKQGKTVQTFAHCLEGGDSGGGILVLGNVLEESLVYTPLIPSTGHYNVNLLNISVNGDNITIDQPMVGTNGPHGTIFDSGTTLAYLPDRTYQDLVNAIIRAAPSSAFVLRGNVCFIVLGSVEKHFPHLMLYFEGASMEVTPSEYLIHQLSADSTPIWCIGWQPIGSANSQLQVTILGDIVLQNKLVVYDLENGRLGWTRYDCSSAINVTVDSRAIKASRTTLFFGGNVTSVRASRILAAVVIMVVLVVSFCL